MYFSYRGNELFWLDYQLTAETAEIEQVLQSRFNYTGPYYLYNLDLFRNRVARLASDLKKFRFFYSVKSLSNINILKLLTDYDHFGLDIVSGGELKRALAAGFSPDQIVFAGVGKSSAEISRAVESGIYSFHIESIAELRRISEICSSKNKPAGITLRLNPDVEVDTHRHITTGKKENKFGISDTDIDRVCEIIKENPLLEFKGLQAHVGSQITEAAPYFQIFRILEQTADRIEEKYRMTAHYISLGGGLGIDYTLTTEEPKNEVPLNELKKIAEEPRFEKYSVYFEPGRYLSAYAGVIISQVEYIKEKENYDIAIIDAAMNDLIRPALYDAEHPVMPLRRTDNQNTYDIVGPVCESADTFNRKLKMSELKEGDRLALLHTGAYGSVMGSNYNSRPLLPEIGLENNKIIILRKPQKIEDLISSEMLL